MTQLEGLQRENEKLERILKRRSPLFGIIIFGLVVCLCLVGMLYAQTARLVGQNSTVAVQNREYLRCLAEVFIKSQDQKVTSLDLDRCVTTTQDNPTPVATPQDNPIVPTTTQGVSVPPRRFSQNGTQGAQGTQGNPGQSAQQQPGVNITLPQLP